jgi:drug/metabolite transporter (DMT)-like permease
MPLMLFALAALWGASYLFIRIAVPALGPFPLAAGRTLVAALVLWVGLRILRKRLELRPHWRRLLVLGATNAALPFFLIGAAELRITASLAAMLTATTPFWAMLFAAYWLGERLTVGRSLGLVLGIVGVGVLVGWSPIPLTGPVLLSVGAMLVASCAYGFAGVYTKRRLAGVPPSTLAIGQQLAAAAWLLPPALWSVPRVDPTPGAAAALLALALFCTALAYPLFFRLIETIGPTRTSTITYLIPIFGTLWGTLFLDEAVTPGMLVGLALILGSVGLVNGVRVGDILRRAGVPAATTMSRET